MNIHNSSDKILKFMSNEKILEFIEEVFKGDVEDFKQNIFLCLLGQKDLALTKITHM